MTFLWKNGINAADIFPNREKKERNKQMKKIAVFFGEGYEEIDALTVVDICR